MSQGAAARGAVIRVNGSDRALSGPLLADLARELGLEAERAGVAVAVNGVVVPRAEWGRRRLVSGDVVEIVGAVQGG